MSYCFFIIFDYTQSKSVILTVFFFKKKYIKYKKKKFFFFLVGVFLVSFGFSILF